ncbi:MAG: hypothetical protein DWQ37_04915, partial [Planctomycetota bacterium]
MLSINPLGDASVLQAIVPDPYEPNDDFVGAADLGAAGHIEQPGLSIHDSLDEDYFSFTADATGDITVQALFTDAEGDLDLYVYNSTPSQIGSSASANDNEEVTFAAVAGETYYVNVYGFNGATNASYDLVIDGPAITGGIRGYKWHDLDGEGDWDPGEPGVEGWTIYLDTDGSGSWDPGEPTTLTQADDLGTVGIDETGAYEFDGLLPGPYIVGEFDDPAWVQTFPGAAPPAPASPLAMSTTASTAPMFFDGFEMPASGEFELDTAQSSPLINLDDFRADPRFTGIDGSGFATVVLDTGIDLDHPFFGPDNDTNGVADRIVYQFDFSGANDADATDVDGHGSNVASIVGSQDGSIVGMAPGVDLIALKVFGDDNSGSFGDLEEALQWVVANAATYNIASINMSLSDDGNYGITTALYGISDELAALAAAGVIVVSSAGNDFFSNSSVQGVGYPAADVNSLAVSAVWDANYGGPINWSGGAIDHTTGPDRLTSFSQRHSILTDIAAPGAFISGANESGGSAAYGGTSQAAPHIAGIAALAQDLAMSALGRLLTPAEFRLLLQDSATLVFDGDDENDNVVNTNLNYPRVDVFALGEAILDMVTVPAGSHQVVVTAGAFVENVDFGNQLVAGAQVLGRQIFYNGSKFDGFSTAINASDDAAIATDKSAYLPGSGPSTFSNITSYTRGINGVMVDIVNPAGTLTVADFTFKMSTQVGANNTPSTWAAAPAPTAFSVRTGAGVSGSDRVEIVWADGAIANRWLEVIVEGNDAAGGSNTNTGLAESDIFFFGNRIGDAGSGTPTLAIT